MSASLSATDYCRKHPSEVDKQVRLFYFAAVGVRILRLIRTPAIEETNAIAILR
jgi:hypothetical protein